MTLFSGIKKLVAGYTMKWSQVFDLKNRYFFLIQLKSSFSINKQWHFMGETMRRNVTGCSF